ncbi:MAG TPA: lauroyl acyltransferase, partial [Candidatus Kapabacteria bacterium]|nr:lauroyl acyltransferase [Candidatus Kapabacteria bacterium]
MKFFINTFSTIFILFLSLIATILPRKARGYFGKMLGYLIMILSSSRRQITLDNLNKAFPEKSKDWIEKTSKQSFA